MAIFKIGLLGGRQMELEGETIADAISRFGKENYWLAGLDLTCLDVSGVKLERVNLRGSCLGRADFRGSELRSCSVEGASAVRVDFSKADLWGTIFEGSDLRRANFSKANLKCASFRRTALNFADFRGAYLEGADFTRAEFFGARFEGARLNWESHALIAAILFERSEDYIQRRVIAGLIDMSKDWYWDNFLAIDHPEKEWALNTLALYVKDGDYAPDILQERAKKLNVDTAWSFPR